MVAVCVVLVGVLGVLDYLTGWELGFFVFYFIPIGLAAWSAGPWTAYGLAFLSALAWLLADHHSLTPYSSNVYFFWNGVIRLVAFVIIAWSVRRVRDLLEQEQRTSENLKAALAQIRTLSGLLPICSACKMIRNDQGYWEQIESYFEKHSEFEFTHGLCGDCARRLYPDRPGQPASDQRPGPDGSA
jgi:hypothetical protein